MITPRDQEPARRRIELKTLEELARAIGKSLSKIPRARIPVADEATARYVQTLAMRYPTSFERYLQKHVKHPSEEIYALSVETLDGQIALLYSPRRSRQDRFVRTK